MTVQQVSSELISWVKGHINVTDKDIQNVFPEKHQKVLHIFYLEGKL